jgi:purine nucleosidase
LVKTPDIAAGIGELVVMGGACFEIGNVTPAAEFNIHVDPHAAAIVLESGIPITMIPLDVTHQVLSTPSRIAALRALGNCCGPAVASLLSGFEAARTSKFGERGMALHDPCVTAYLLRPTLFSGRDVNVAVETASTLTTGMTVIDWWGVTGRKPNSRFLTTVDADGLYDVLTERLSLLP